jgi:hypothetical protein
MPTNVVPGAAYGLRRFVPLSEVKLKEVGLKEVELKEVELKEVELKELHERPEERRPWIGPSCAPSRGLRCQRSRQSAAWKSRGSHLLRDSLPPPRLQIRRR